MKKGQQYHFTVVAEARGDSAEDGFNVYLDDADSGIFPDGSMWYDPEDDPQAEDRGWSCPDTTDDIAAWQAVSDALQRGLRGGDDALPATP